MALPTQQIRLLGPVDILIGQVAHPVAGQRRQAVLATLALSPGQPVTTDRLIDIVWGADAPATAHNTLQRHVSFLRSLVGNRDAVVSAGAGYQLNLGAECTDLHLAEKLIARAAQGGTAEFRATTLRSALGLWRGDTLAELTEIPWFAGQAERIEQRRHSAYASLTEARLELGEHLALAPELENLARERPFDEALYAQLVLALYRCGRQAESLRALAQIRERLKEELGVDPGRALRELETAILRHDPSLEAAAPAVAVAAPHDPHLTPAQLPPALPKLVGRDEELARLDAHAASGVLALSGPPGIGKTSLAVFWARKAAADFPDGQLYVNLRGFDPGDAVVEPADALHGFLEALGVQPRQVPQNPAAMGGMYRSLLAGKRVLVLLDNARDAEHVRPLLPGAPGSLTLVTSRNRLTSLVASEGADWLPLEALSHEASRAMLAQRVGDKRLAGEPDAADVIIAECAGLPLALGIAAARAATEPGVSLAAMAGDMLASTGPLDALSGGDRASDVRAVISWSYAVLDEAVARQFRLLALHPGVTFSIAAAASLAGVAQPQARRMCAGLAAANLLIPLDAGRYAFHDLIRAYALEKVRQDDSEAERTDALCRLLGHYLHTADTAAGQLDVYRDTAVTGEPPAGVSVTALAGHEQALDWALTEHSVLVGLVRNLTGPAFDPYTWQIACTLVEFFERRGLWQDWHASFTAAIEAAQRLGDPRALAFTHNGLGRAYHWQARYTEAQASHRASLAHFTDLGDLLGQARVWHSLGRLAELRGEPQQALENTRRGLELFRAADDKPGIAKALNGVGWYHCLLGDYREALSHCGEALTLLQALGDRRVEANTWDSLGYAYHHAGDYPQAIDCYERAIAIFRETADRYHEADASVHLGDTHADTGDVAAAESVWRHALEILDDLKHADAAQVHSRLARLHHL